VGHKPDATVGVSPVGYASDSKGDLSSTPATPIGVVDGVGDRWRILSLA
jgi:hypothetical protein